MWGIIRKKGQLRTGRCGLMLFRCDYAGTKIIIIIIIKNAYYKVVFLLETFIFSRVSWLVNAGSKHFYSNDMFRHFLMTSKNVSAKKVDSRGCPTEMQRQNYYCCIYPSNQRSEIYHITPKTHQNALLCHLTYL